METVRVCMIIILFWIELQTCTWHPMAATLSEIQSFVSSLPIWTFSQVLLLIKQKSHLFWFYQDFCRFSSNCCCWCPGNSDFEWSLFLGSHWKLHVYYHKEEMKGSESQVSTQSQRWRKWIKNFIIHLMVGRENWRTQYIHLHHLHN